MHNLEKAYGDLELWADSMIESIKEHRKELFEATDANKDLPEGCPSHSSMALLIFKQIDDDLEEVQAAAQNIRESLSNLGH